MKTFLAWLFWTGAALAVPPLDPAAAAAWADQTVTTSVPKEERIYILGPETQAETYLLDGKPASHLVVVRRIVSAQKVHALGDLALTRFGKMPVTTEVYPAGASSLAFSTGNTRSDYPLHAGDLVTVRLGP